jgi:putative acetyltransferase
VQRSLRGFFIRCIMSINIREIREEDDAALFSIVEKVMTEFGASREGTVLGDPVIRHMSRSFAEKDAVYYVAEVNGEIAGGCGIKQLDGSSEKICELQRMFLLSNSRRLGIGKKLLDLCLEKAREFGYTHCYLESLPSMEAAYGLYKKAGFEDIPGPMGNTGHGSCTVWMLKKL